MRLIGKTAPAARMTALMFAIGAFASQSALAQEYQSRSVGGPGGTPFTMRCADGDYLVGLRARSGNYVDAIAPLCARWQAGDQSFLPPGIGPLHGGGGGKTRDFQCDSVSVITGMVAEPADNPQSTVALVAPICSAALPPNRRTAADGFQFGTSFTERNQHDDPGVGSTTIVDYDMSKMPMCNHGDVAVGIYGGAGTLVDRIGLICSPAPQRLVMIPPVVGAKPTRSPAEHSVTEPPGGIATSVCPQPIIGSPGTTPLPRMSGTFDTDFGVLTLGANGGTYTFNNGHVCISKIVANMMDGTWTQSESSQRCADGTYHGLFHFTFNQDGFTGTYGYCDRRPNAAGRWNGRRR